MADIVRELGMIEKACSIRHDLGHYPCASIAATHSFTRPQTGGKARWAVKKALSDVVLSQPIMCCGIIGEETQSPAYIRLEKIDIASCIDFVPQDKSYFEDVTQGSQTLAKILESQHETLFPDLHRRPGWRVLVMVPGDDTLISQIDVLFAWHHGFFDGLSGVNFHKGFLRGMNRALDATETDDRFLVTVPRSLHINAPIESLMKFPVTWKYYFNMCWNYYIPAWISALMPGLSDSPTPVWAGSKTHLSSKEDYRMRMRIVPFSADDVKSLLGKARQNKQSLTCLFHAAMAAAIAMHVPEAQSFLTLTPLSLRNYTGNDKNEAMGNEFDDLWCTYDRATLAATRRLQNAETKDLSPLWEAGKMFKTTLTEHRKQLPWDLELAFPKGWFDVRALHLAQVGKDRAITFEMSNIGSIEQSPSADKTGPQHSHISRFVWAQSAMVTGPLFTVGSASVDGGPLSFTFAWQKDAMEDSFADTVIGTFQDLLKRVIAA